MSSVRGTSNLLKRCASSAAQAAPKAAAPRTALPSEPVVVSKATNGLRIATLENHSPVARVAAVVKTGARDETSSQVGASHAMRVCSSLATRNYSLFGVSRNLNQIGAELTVTSNREETVYLLESTRNNLSRGVDILAEIVSRPEFYRWEVDDAKARLNFDLDVYDQKPELKIVDLLHRAAFRNGLSRSLYAPRYNVGSLSDEVLRDFRAKNYTAGHLSLIGTGVRHEDLIHLSDLFRLPEDSAGSSRAQAKYLGSEVREDNLSQLVHAAIAFEGASASSKDALLSSLVSHAFGTGGPRVKYSSGGSKIEKSVSALASSPMAVSSFNANYSDAGLFGFHVVANKSDVGKVVKGVFRELQAAGKTGFNEQEVARAKNSYKLALALSLDSSQGVIEAIVRNPDNANNQLNASELFKAVDAVSATEINNFVKKMSVSKASLAAIGDLSELPNVDELAAQ